MAQPSAVTGARPSAIEPHVRSISTADLSAALRKGYADFMAMPSHLIFVSLLYPIAGLIIATFAFGLDLNRLLFPLASGFALIGPLAAIGLYELSRRREAGLEVRWQHAIDVLRSPAIGSVLGMGLVLVVIFILWLLTANALFGLIMGHRENQGFGELLREVLTTRRGWVLIVVGNLVGLAFAAVVLTISVVAFPLILDRNVGVGTAIATSRRAVFRNPVTMATWGFLVAALLVLGSIPLFVGLAIVMPVLGHATWHLYRAVVEP